MEQYPRLYLVGDDALSQVSCLIQDTVADTYPLHSHHFYEFFYVASGKAIHQINSTTEVIAEGALFFIRPDDIHAYSFLTNYDMELVSCGIQPELMERTCQFLDIDLDFITKPELPPHVILDHSRRWDIMNEFQQINKKEAGPERTRYFLTILPKLIYLFYSTKKAAPKVLPVWLKDLLLEMDKPENYTVGLGRMLQLSNISQEHLNREFRRFLDLTPTEYINSRRIHYAGQLLLSHQYEIVDICYLCGYNNLSYFYRMFKKQYHCTPVQFVQKYAAHAES